MGLEALFIIVIVGFMGMTLAFLRNSYPSIKYFVDTIVEAVKDLKKFKRQKPL